MNLHDLLEPNGDAKTGAPLGALLSAQAMRAPDAPAVTAEGTTVSRAALDRRSNRRARQLAQLGVGENDRVVIALPNSLEYYETAFAVWKLGATPAHVSHRLTPVEFDEVMELAEPKLIVGGVDSPTPWPRLPAGVRPDPTLSDDPLPIKIAKSWKISTSGGSTGRPKLIVDPHAAIWGVEKQTVRRGPDATVINPGPLYHSAPFAIMLMGICQGAHLIEGGRFDPENYLSLVARHRANWAYLVPTMMGRIATLPADIVAKYDVSSLKTVLHMASVCPVWVKQFWIDLLGPDAIWEVYGGTERFGSTIIGGTEWLSHKGSVGRPRPGIEIAIMDEAGAPLPVGEVGEIYFYRPGAEDETFRYIGATARRHGSWTSFGDLGWVDAEGYLYIADRRTDLIICGGVNLYPAEIEAALDGCPGVVTSVVVGLPDPDLGQRPHAVVQVAPGAAASFDVPALRAALEQRLAKIKIPRSIEVTTDHIRDEAGKVRRSAWREACRVRLGINAAGE